MMLMNLLKMSLIINFTGGFFMKLKRILVLALVLFATLPCFALGVNQEIYAQWRYAQQEKTFDHVEKISTVLVGPTAVVTPTDIVSTNTASIYYLNDSPTYPIKLIVQNHGTASLTWNIYSTSVAAGVDVPDGNDCVLLDDNGAVCASNKATSFVFYQTPNISFSSTSTASATFIIESIKSY